MRLGYSKVEPDPPSEVGFGEIARYDLLQARFWITSEELIGLVNTRAFIITNPTNRF
jgi:hypothetical protein